MFKTTSENVKKILAYDGKRIEIDSTADEMYKFLVGEVRPDFDDANVIAVRFILSDNPDNIGAEETSWFINTEFMEDLCPDRRYEEDPNFMLEGFGPKMDSEFPPEILFLFRQYDDVEVLNKFKSYSRTVELDEMSSEEIYDDFAEWLKQNAYNDEV